MIPLGHSCLNARYRNFTSSRLKQKTRFIRFNMKKFDKELIDYYKVSQVESAADCWESWRTRIYCLWTRKPIIISRSEGWMQSSQYLLNID